MRFDRKGMLSLRYVKPYNILRLVGVVDYELALPAELASINPFFHVSMLNNVLCDPASILLIKVWG